MKKSGSANNWSLRPSITGYGALIMVLAVFTSIKIASLFAASPVFGAKEAKQKGGSKVLLELFTSQGCSSCPAADALLPDFIARKDVIALSLSIDYWDYLGWRDTFGQRIFTTRQRSYGKRIGDNMVYTPQMVVDGRVHMNGSDRATIRAAIEKRRTARALQPPVELSLKTDGDMLLVNVGQNPDQGAPQKATLWLALFSKHEKVKIKRGENRGRHLSYHNVVRELTPIGHWSGDEVIVKLPMHQIVQRGSDGCVVMLQKDDGGPIIAAAQMSSW
jgi:hypothetical protein